MLLEQSEGSLRPCRIPRGRPSRQLLLARTQQLLNQAQRLAYDINQIDQAFQSSYPPSYAGSTSPQQLLGDAQTRWRNSLAAYQDALRVQASVVQSFNTTRTPTDTLVSSSQSAVGILQAAQAGNQLIALQTRQLLDLTALVAAQSRPRASMALAQQPTRNRRAFSSIGFSPTVGAIRRRPCKCTISEAEDEHQDHDAGHRLSPRCRRSLQRRNCVEQSAISDRANLED